MEQRGRPYQDKRRVYTFIFVIVILLLALIFLRFVLGGDEDTWICEDGVWVEHGHPSDPMPTSQCE